MQLYGKAAFSVMSMRLSHAFELIFMQRWGLLTFDDAQPRLG